MSSKRKSSKEPSCPKHYILREGYTRKSYSRKDGSRVKSSYVPSVCVKGLHGRSSKGIPLIKIKDKHLLKPYGYSTKKDKYARRRALKQAVKAMGSLTVLRYVNAIRTLQKSHPKKFKVFDKDVKYLQKKYFRHRKGWMNKVSRKLKSRATHKKDYDKIFTQMGGQLASREILAGGSDHLVQQYYEESLDKTRQMKKMFDAGVKF